MNDTLKAAGRIGAELAAAKAEVQREMERHRKTWRQLEQVTGLLDGVRKLTKSQRMDDLVWLMHKGRIDAALSQQAEPAAVNQCDGCQAGAPVDNNGNHRMGKPGGYADLMRCEKARYVSEPAPAQDERAAFEQAFVIQEGVYWSEDHQSYRSMNGRAIEERDAIDATMFWLGWSSRAELATRPAQTDGVNWKAVAGEQKTVIEQLQARLIAQIAPQARNVVAYRTIDRHGNVITDWIDGDPAGGDPIVPGGSFQLAYGAPQPEQSGIADLPYQTLFNAIAASTDAGDAPISISVKAFLAALSATPSPAKRGDA